MKTILKIFIMLGLISAAVAMQPEKALPLDKVCIFNIRRDGEETEEGRLWRNRFPLIRDFLLREKPDVIGLQEAKKNQIEDLLGGLPKYSWIGQERGKILFGFVGPNEAVPIFYNSETVRPINSGTFWLNGYGLPWNTGWLWRICTWALVELNGQEVYFFNTHLDNQYPGARGGQLLMLLTTMKNIVKKDDIPVFLIGDFNAPLPELSQHLGDFSDTRDVGKKVGPEPTHASWGGFKAPERVDHILLKKSRASWRVPIEKVTTHDEANSFIRSDHWPVIAEFRIRPKSLAEYKSNIYE